MTDPVVGEADIIEALVIEHRPMAARLAKRYSRGIGVDPDLRQVADLGLFLAATRYDESVGPFRPFAMVTIVGELKKHLRSHGWAVRVPRRLQEASITVATEAERLEQQLDRSPTPQEIADATGITLELVLQAIQVRNARFAVEPDEHSTVQSEHRTDEVDASLDLIEAASSLSSDERELIVLRYERELTQRQIADHLDISQSQVHRRLTAVINELRSLLDDESDGQP